MLTCAIPSYRLSRDVIRKEIESLIDKNIEVKCNAALGKDISLDSLFKDGYQAVLLAMGAHKSRPLYLENEDTAGVYPSIEFLKAFNLRREALAKGRVGVIGGGNSAIDAARTALRQKDVTEVTILYRRTHEEMPAFEEEIEAAGQEGIKIITLVTPKRIITEHGHIAALECIKNELGETDSSGRRKPVPIDGTEHTIEFDTLIVAISEDAGVDCLGPAIKSGIETNEWGTVKTDPETLLTNRPGVFAAGDLVTGPNTVVQAIAAGKKAALMIERLLKNEDLIQPVKPNLPKVFIEPVEIDQEVQPLNRAETPRAPAEWRRRSFAEVEVALSVEEAMSEAKRCLRCDLEFTKRAVVEENKSLPIGELKT
jgi:NADH-quinone oxidoreductase subunit F